jgi:hypothetical protein
VSQWSRPWGTTITSLEGDSPHGLAMPAGPVEANSRAPVVENVGVRSCTSIPRADIEVAAVFDEAIGPRAAVGQLVGIAHAD